MLNESQKSAYLSEKPLDAILICQVWQLDLDISTANTTQTDDDISDIVAFSAGGDR